MKCSSVALGLAAAQLVAGLGLTVLPIHTMLKLPSLATRDCPLWAAGPLLCAGIIGIIAVYSNTNYKSQNNRKPIFILKIVSFALSSLSGVLCLVAAAFLVLHVLLYIDRYTQCRDDPMRRQCLCALAEGAARFYRYDRVTCLQVHSTVKGLFYTTAAVSVLGGVCSLWYLTLLWSSRYVYFNAGLRRTLVDPLPGGGDMAGEQYSAAEAEHNDAPPRRLPQLTVSPS
ncbi:hypothetical protein HPB49_021882 [Dermacentor silvarum]|uniref:Uncharacterized protein n=1 Tax=Dermacentor silvarum TaxID=543639 RepID=A0ACB8CHC9_DERSI|nr:uncharacterized protein LOC119458634 [Dermacentor silvarum]XP_037576407.1 uncharacterized protein LOC119458634 [Dermacentor silvarum]KAH7942205.1 hypothetical protein HPB49_021882 [Dermacentor silvarum]